MNFRVVVFIDHVESLAASDAISGFISLIFIYLDHTRWFIGHKVIECPDPAGASSRIVFILVLPVSKRFTVSFQTVCFCNSALRVITG